jgi:hypothetical protein
MIARRLAAGLIAALVALPLAAPGAAGQGAVTFNGRVVHVDGMSTANLRVGFGTLGSTTTRPNGQFSTAIPGTTAEVRVEILEHDWVVLYPRDGRVAVPRDPDRVVEIVVGESVEAATLRHFAERHERLAAGLQAVGAAQDEIRGVLTGFLQEVTQRLDVEASALERQIEMQRKRGEHYPELSATIRTYVLEARDLNTIFRLYGATGFRDRDAYDALAVAVARYNDAFQKLDTERMALEYQVRTYWESEELRSDLRSLFDYALGEVHAIQILPLNDSLVEMHAALFSRRPDRARVREAQARIARAVEELDLRLPELQRRADRVLQFLYRS